MGYKCKQRLESLGISTADYSVLPQCLRRCGIIPADTKLSREQLCTLLDCLTIANADAAQALADRLRGKNYTPDLVQHKLPLATIHGDGLHPFKRRKVRAERPGAWPQTASAPTAEPGRPPLPAPTREVEPSTPAADGSAATINDIYCADWGLMVAGPSRPCLLVFVGRLSWTWAVPFCKSFTGTLMAHLIWMQPAVYYLVRLRIRPWNCH